MPKLYDMWTELKLWLEIEDAGAEGRDEFKDVLDKMDELESEYE